MSWTPRTFCVAAILAAFVMTPLARAQEDPAAAPVAEESSLSLSVSLGVDFTTQYWFRGIFQENQGLIAQPWAEIGLGFFESEEGPINSLTAIVGTWNSLHGGPSGEDGSFDDPELWYEADVYGGVAVGLFDDFTFTVLFTNYDSPNDAFTTTQDLTFKLAYDDSELLGAFALSPYVAIATETHGGADGTSGEGVYLEFGIAPSFVIVEDENYPITLSLPVTLGLSLDDYYQDGSGADETFGYLDMGAELALPMSFMPEGFGEWTMTFGVHYIRTGENTRDDSGDRDNVYGVIGVSAAF